MHVPFLGEIIPEYPLPAFPRCICVTICSCIHATTRTCIRVTTSTCTTSACFKLPAPASTACRGTGKSPSHRPALQYRNIMRMCIIPHRIIVTLHTGTLFVPPAAPSTASSPPPPPPASYPATCLRVCRQQQVRATANPQTLFCLLEFKAQNP